MLEEESDEEMRELAKEELNDAKNRVAELENELKILLLPKDPNDDKNVIVEIRAGAGGDEAALFAAEVYRMYVHYATIFFTVFLKFLPVKCHYEQRNPCEILCLVLYIEIAEFFNHGNSPFAIKPFSQTDQE